MFSPFNRCIVLILGRGGAAVVLFSEAPPRLKRRDYKKGYSIPVKILVTHHTQGRLTRYRLRDGRGAFTHDGGMVHGLSLFTP